jgi:hypothetical protein
MGERKNCLKIFLFNSLMEIDRHFFAFFGHQSINGRKARRRMKDEEGNDSFLS